MGELLAIKTIFSKTELTKFNNELDIKNGRNGQGKAIKDTCKKL